MNQASPNVKLLSGVFLAIVLAVAYIYMKANSINEIGLISILSPLVLYLIIGGKVEAENEKQNQVLSKIEYQTNGALEAKIRRVTQKVIHQEVTPRLDSIEEKVEETAEKAQKHRDEAVVHFEAAKGWIESAAEATSNGEPIPPFPEYPLT